MKLWSKNRGKWKGQQSTGVKPRTPLAWAASPLYTGRYCFAINGSYANTTLHHWEHKKKHKWEVDDSMSVSMHGVGNLNLSVSTALTTKVAGRLWKIQPKLGLLVCVGLKLNLKCIESPHTVKRRVQHMVQLIYSLRLCLGILIGASLSEPHTTVNVRVYNLVLRPSPSFPSLAVRLSGRGPGTFPHMSSSVVVAAIELRALATQTAAWYQHVGILGMKFVSSITSSGLPQDDAASH